MKMTESEDLVVTYKNYEDVINIITIQNTMFTSFKGFLRVNFCVDFATGGDYGFCSVGLIKDDNYHILDFYAVSAEGAEITGLIFETDEDGDIDEDFYENFMNKILDKINEIVAVRVEKWKAKAMEIAAIKEWVDFNSNRDYDQYFKDLDIPGYIEFKG